MNLHDLEIPRNQLVWVYYPSAEPGAHLCSNNGTELEPNWDWLCIFEHINFTQIDLRHYVWSNNPEATRCRSCESQAATTSQTLATSILDLPSHRSVEDYEDEDDDYEDHEHREDDD
jgi:hypothetical protein